MKLFWPKTVHKRMLRRSGTQEAQSGRSAKRQLL